MTIIQNDSNPTPARRSFLLSTALGAGGLTVGGLSPTTAFAGTDRIEDALTSILTKTETATLKQLIATALTDPSVPALAASTLQTTVGLTSFQAKLLSGIGDLTKDPGALSAWILGQMLRFQDRASLEAMKDAVMHNAAYRKILYSAKALRSKKNLPTLTNYVTLDAATLSLTLHAPTTLGNAALDSIVGNIANIRNSSVGIKLANALVPIFQDPAFIPFLRKQRESVVAAFIPASVIIGFLLPVDRDPPLSDATRGVLEVLTTIFATVGALLLLPEELALGTLIAALVCIYGGEITGLMLGFDDLFKGIDCDFDGDPSDPSDVPGGEC